MGAPLRAPWWRPAGRAGWLPRRPGRGGRWPGPRPPAAAAGWGPGPRPPAPVCSWPGGRGRPGSGRALPRQPAAAGWLRAPAPASGDWEAARPRASSRRPSGPDGGRAGRTAAERRLPALRWPGGQVGGRPAAAGGWWRRFETTKTTDAIVTRNSGNTYMAPPRPSPPVPAWAADNSLFHRHRRLRPLLYPAASLRDHLPVLSHCLVSGLARNPFVASRLLLASSSLSLPFSLALLAYLPASSLSPFAFNSLIRASPPRLALRMFDQMRSRAVPTDPYTLPLLISACSRSGPTLCQSLHGQGFRLGYNCHLFTQTTLMNVYLTCGLVVTARRVFEEMPVKDVVAWTSMVSGYVDSRMYFKAVEVFNEMRGADDLVSPNEATVASLASACAGLGSLEHAKCLHSYVEKIGLEGELIVRNALLDMYGKCGSIESARRLFCLMREKDLHSWTTMISGLSSHGRGQEAVVLFFSMQEEGVLPDSTTFIVVLSACSHAGLVDEGISIFNSMESDYNVPQDIKHYGCMVDLFSRAGLVHRAYEFISMMPFEPNLEILGALLSACSINNELEIGELVLNKIESVCSYKGGAGVLLSNIYAKQNLWHEVDTLRRKIRTKATVRKPPGQSLISAEVPSTSFF